MDYDQFKIKRYDLWDLQLHTEQYPYIGRCIAWAHRLEADLVTDMNASERDELFDLVVPDWKRAVTELYGPMRPNLSILGNEVAHLHAHLVPRFEIVKLFYGMEFVDPHPRANYSPYPKNELGLEILLRIKEDICSVF